MFLSGYTDGSHLHELPFIKYLFFKISCMVIVEVLYIMSIDLSHVHTHETPYSYTMHRLHKCFNCSVQNTCVINDTCNAPS